MLESKDLGGKCADLNALYVGLARAAGLPARDVYGIRIAKSDLGYKSLGTSSENITKAQHCRAEVYIGGFGWVSVDSADVRKVVLEEPPGSRPLDDLMVKTARGRLFGSWEMNWMAYNFAHDVTLPRSAGAPVGFLMYRRPKRATAGLTASIRTTSSTRSCREKFRLRPQKSDIRPLGWFVASLDRKRLGPRGRMGFMGAADEFNKLPAEEQIRYRRASQTRGLRHDYGLEKEVASRRWNSCVPQLEAWDPK
jgi:hypothetical protein